MEKRRVLNAIVAPLDRANVDTDQIIPKDHLKSIKKIGFADALRHADKIRTFEAQRQQRSPWYFA